MSRHIALSLMLSACGALPTSTHDAFSIASAEALPVCDDAHRNQLYFIESTGTFQACHEGWVTVDVHGAAGAAGAAGSSGESILGPAGANGSTGADGAPANATPALSGSLEGSYTIENVADLEAFQEITELTGNLVIGQGIASLAFPHLQKVGGQISFYAASMSADMVLESLSFPALTSVGKLIMNNVGALTTISLPLLATAGNISLYQVNALPSVIFPELVSADAVYIQGGSLLTGISFPKLSTVGNQGFSVNNLASMTDFSAPILTSVSGAFGLSSCTALTALSLPSLLHVGALSMQSDNALTSISLPMLATVTGDLGISYNSVLRACVVAGIAAQLTIPPGNNSSVGNNGTPDICN